MSFFDLFSIFGGQDASAGPSAWQLSLLNAKLGRVIEHLGIPEKPVALSASVQEALDMGRKIEAIQRYRKETGVSLAQAKDAIERKALAPQLSLQRRIDLLLEHFNIPADDDKADALLGEMGRAGRKIEAIKIYRERTGASLTDAKEHVEMLMAR